MIVEIGHAPFTQLHEMRHIQRIFSLRLVCPIRNIGGVIRKGGVFINQIRRESGAIIKVDSTSATEADDCLVTILAKERLHLFKVNLLKESSLDSIVKGFVGVFHAAFPFFHAITNLTVWYQLHPEPTCMIPVCMATLLNPFSKPTCLCHLPSKLIFENPISK